MERRGRWLPGGRRGANERGREGYDSKKNLVLVLERETGRGQDRQRRFALMGGEASGVPRGEMMMGGGGLPEYSCPLMD